jgi:hypothetical protein
MGDSSRRRYQRFAFPYRIQVSFGGLGQTTQVDGVTRNVSTGGLLLESAVFIPSSSAVRFTIIAQGDRVFHPMEFTGEGEVVRVETDPSRAAYAIAIKCIRPIQFHPFERKDFEVAKQLPNN